MLIKLGNVWVDPAKVMCLESSPSEPTTLIWLPGTPDDCVNAAIPADEAAEAINRALGQMAAPSSEDKAATLGPPALTMDERVALTHLWDEGHRWIARSGPGNILAFECEPQKSMGIWTPATWKTRPVPELRDKLPWLYSDDPVATPIGWLLGLKEAGGDGS